jgi:hypothetical protein
MDEEKDDDLFEDDGRTEDIKGETNMDTFERDIVEPEIKDERPETEGVMSEDEIDAKNAEIAEASEKVVKDLERSESERSDKLEEEKDMEVETRIEDSTMTGGTNVENFDLQANEHFPIEGETGRQAIQAEAWKTISTERRHVTDDEREGDLEEEEAENRFDRECELDNEKRHKILMETRIEARKTISTERRHVTDDEREGDLEEEEAENRFDGECELDNEKRHKILREYDIYFEHFEQVLLRSLSFI